MKPFDSREAVSRLEKFWALRAEFGQEHAAVHIYLSEIVSDRYLLVNGLQLLHDELQLAGLGDHDHHGDVVACGVDLSLPTVLTTLAHTNCGDRIHQGEATTSYEQIVATRFACMSEIGELKLEAFSPTGGGTDDGQTLSHVTVSHAMDASIHRRLYEGNPSSYPLINIDLKTHVGRLEIDDDHFMIGQTRESKWRDPRAACGAIVGTLKAFNEANNVHRRIRADLGEANYGLLSTKGVQTAEGIDISAAVAAAIVAVQGMRNTAQALSHELDERGVGHLTASTTVNRPHLDDTILYFARATVFGGEVKLQGFGTDASKFSGRVVRYHDDNRLMLAYEGYGVGEYPITTSRYHVATGSHSNDETA